MIKTGRRPLISIVIIPEQKLGRLGANILTISVHDELVKQFGLQIVGTKTKVFILL